MAYEWENFYIIFIQEKKMKSPGFIYKETGNMLS